MKYLMSLLVIFISHSAFATGCLGGNWYTTSKVELPDASASLQGNPLNMQVNMGKTWIYVTLKAKIDNKEVFLVSGSLNLEKYNGLELLHKVSELPAQIVVRAIQEIQTNPYYDDCYDVPENTEWTQTYYSFDVPISNDQIVSFSGYTESYNPPLNH